MIYLYPANKMENLLALLNKIQQLSPLAVFSKEVIVVHNAGMQHWLNLSLAKQRDISMNIDYALPSQYLWKLVRSLAEQGKSSEQTPYSREVLAWRIDSLLKDEKVINDELFTSVNHYWQVDGWQVESRQEEGCHNSANSANTQQAHLKRFQLASQLADLYEQYLIFRPDWLDNWQHTATLKNRPETITEESNLVDGLIAWQAKLWQLLIDEIPYNPKKLITSAINNIANAKQSLPPRVSFFGINSLAPMWLDFISALSEHTEVHFFHLNPCFDYWGDVVSEKQAIKMQKTWLAGALDTDKSITEHALTDLVGNPLLANLGQQGREFLAMLQQVSTINIEVFQQFGNDIGDKFTPPSGVKSQYKHSALAHIQNDILSLTDGRNSPQVVIDHSITITSCHSALREVQGLHDYLLQQFNQDPTLTPKDILVMCPQVENYAPYIDAVFSRSWQDKTEQNQANVPSLPCSIADRVSKDSEPLVAAFIELLQLPDSRFQVSKLIAFLRLPAMQSKFSLTTDDIEKISYWLEQASIHWGLNAEHKQQVLKIEHSNAKFTWQNGLARLMLGFAYGDSEVIYQQQLLLPNIEGNDALLLGKLLQILEQLQYVAQHLLSDKTAIKWSGFLQNIVEQLFIVENETAFEIIEQAIYALVDFCAEAKYHDKISLAVVREFLQTHFSQPDPGRQFLVGQITFCSMLPMRSIPFKVIAVLGLNDGEFPRQRQPLGFDLMSLTPARVGDRSRRGDDRYLFLEALISARQALYLSYQGRNIRNNSELQPSLVLKELMEYLDLAYGWSLLVEKEDGILNENTATQGKVTQLPMQPFSLRNYQVNSEKPIQSGLPSFDVSWLKLAQQTPLIIDPPLLLTSNAINATTTVNETSSLELKIDIDISFAQLVSFFEHPAKYFAKNQLNLHFEQYQAEPCDVEPFNYDNLASYHLKQALLNSQLSPQLSIAHVSSEQVNSEQVNSEELVAAELLKAQLSDKFPDSPLTTQEFNHWQGQTQLLSDVVMDEIDYAPCSVEVSFVVNVDEQNIRITGKLPIVDQQCVAYRTSSAKAKDLFTLYLYRLVSLVFAQKSSKQKSSQQKNLEIQNIKQSVGWYFNTKSQQIFKHSFAEITDAKQELATILQVFLMGQQQALLINGNIAKTYFEAINKNKTFEQAQFEELWQSENNFQPLSQDPYMEFFWRECPHFNDHQSLLSKVYRGLYQAHQQEKVTRKGSK